MIATAFDEENAVLDPPPGVSLDDCTVLSVWRGLQASGAPVVISCWKPTAEELEEIQRTGRVWVIVLGETMPPVAVSGMSPWKPAPEETTDG